MRILFEVGVERLRELLKLYVIQDPGSRQHLVGDVYAAELFIAP